MKRCAELYGNIQKSWIKSLDDNNLDAIDKTMNNTSVDKFNAFYQENVKNTIDEATNVASQFKFSGTLTDVNAAVQAAVKRNKFDNYVNNLKFNSLLGGKPRLIK